MTRTLNRFKPIPQPAPSDPRRTRTPAFGPSQQYWLLDHDQLDCWDRYSKNVLLWIHGKLQEGLLEQEDMLTSVVATRARLPKMEVPQSAPMHSFRAPPDPALSIYRHDYFAHWPEEFRHKAQFAWVLGDGNCLLNAVAMAVAHRQRYRPGQPRAGRVPGVLTLRLALVLAMLADLSKVKSLPRLQPALHDTADLMMTTAADGGWLYSDHAVFLSEILQRDIWMLNPILRGIDGLSGRIQVDRTLQRPQLRPIFITWCGYAGSPEETDLHRLSPGVYDPSRGCHFSAIRFPDTTDFSTIAPPMFPPPDWTGVYTEPRHTAQADPDTTQPQATTTRTPVSRRLFDLPPTTDTDPTENTDRPRPHEQRQPRAPGSPSGPAPRDTPPHRPPGKRRRLRLSPRAPRHVAKSLRKRRSSPWPSVAAFWKKRRYSSSPGGKTPAGGNDDPKGRTDETPHTHPTGSPPPVTTTKRAAGPGDDFVLTTYNVRGLHTSKQDILAVLEDHRPHVLVVTETKLPQARSKLKGYRKGYNGYHSWVSCSTARAGGVMILLHEDILQTATITQWTLPPFCDGHILGLTIDIKGARPAHVMGLYLPAEESVERLALEDKVGELTKQLNNPSETLLLAGDVNSSPAQDGRSSRRSLPRDTRFREFLCRTGLDLLGPPQKVHSWHEDNGRRSSRLDQVVADARYAVKTPLPPPGERQYLSDHVPVTAVLSRTLMQLHIPPPDAGTEEPTPIRKYDTPTPEQVEALRLEIASTHGAELLDITSIARQAHTPHGLASVYNRLLSTLNHIQTELMPRHIPNRVFYRGNTKYRPRTVANSRRKAMKLLRALRALDPDDSAIAMLGDAECQTLIDMVDEAETSSAGEAAAAVKLYMKSLDRAYLSSHMQQAALRQRHLFQDKPKSFHSLLSSSVDKPDIKPLRAVIPRDTDGLPTGPVVTTGGDIKDSVHKHFSSLLRPPAGDPQLRYPWNAPGALDALDLTKGGDDPSFLRDHLTDKATLLTCIASLAGGKAPGPDGIVNETYKYSPPILTDCIHSLFSSMFTVGTLPPEISRTTTVLLYKKGDPTNLNNYRPVGLVNTLMKLWTKLVAGAIRDYTEEHQILSSSQAGFRPGHHTHIQTQLLATALEDARLFKRDIYMSQVDFTNAFNRINHQKLYRILTDLGFPDDVRRLVHGIYAHCRTDYRTPYGHTDSLPVRRGTIQGDSLSPILFAIYIEPLLRWLHSGGRGYLVRNTPGDTALDALAYADDLGTLTDNLADHQTQVAKIDQFSRWADLTPNLSKSFHTAALHRTLGNDITSPKSLTYVKDLLHDTTPLGGGHLQYQPPNTTFEYLGIKFTMTLDWSPQRQELLQTCQETCRAIAYSRVTGSAKRITLDRWIRRKLAYTFAVVPLSGTQLEALDAPIRAVIKSSFGINKAMGTAFLRDSVSNFGMAQEAISKTYFAESTRHLIWALNHPGRLGIVSRTVLDYQLKELWFTPSPGFEDTRFLSLARRFLMVTNDGMLRLDTPEGPYSPPEVPEHVKVFRDRILAETERTDRPCRLPMKRLRPIWELLDDPRSLMHEGSMWDEATIRRHAKIPLAQPHIRALRTLAHATCIGGERINPELEHWPNTPLTGRQLTLRPQVRAIITDSLDRCPLNDSWARAAPIPRTATQIHQAPAITYKTVDEARSAQITALLRAHPQPDRQRSITYLLSKRPKNIAERSWTGSVLEHVYGARFQVAQILEERTRSLAGDNQKLYLVRWADSAVDRWAAPMLTKAGYQFRIVGSDNSPLEDTLCDICLSPTQSDETVCPHLPYRRHAACGAYTRQCPHNSRTRSGTAQIPPPGQQDWVTIRWENTYEPEINLIQEGYGTMIDAWQARRLRPRWTHIETPGVLTQTGLQNDGDFDINPSDLRAIRGCVTTQPAGVRPDLDIRGPLESPTVCVRDVPYLGENSGGNLSEIYIHTTSLTFHDRQGTTVGWLPRPVVEMLTHAFSVMRHHFRGVHDSLQARDLGTELFLMSQRHRDLSVPPAWALLSHIWRPIQHTLGITADLSAGPLSLLPGTTKFWTKLRRDSLFGAHLATNRITVPGGSVRYDCPLTATSLLRDTVAEIQRQLAPSTRLLLLPLTRGGALTGILEASDGWATLLGTADVHLVESASDRVATTRPVEGKRTALSFVVVSNIAGWTQLGRAGAKHRLGAMIHTTLRESGLDGAWTAGDALWAPPKVQATHITRSWARRLDPARSAGWEIRHTPTDGEAVTTTDLPLLRQSTDIIWTDGTYKAAALDNERGEAPARSGAALWQRDTGAHTLATFLTVTGPARGDGVNRAELAAIAQAAMDTRATALTIATDSLVSIYQIRRFLRNPRDYRTHPQRGLLQELAGNLLARTRAGNKTHITKVKAHAGCPGNVMADRTAAGECAPDSTVEMEPQAALPPRWLARLDPSTHSWTPLANLKNALRRNTPRSFIMGKANQHTCYFQAYSGVASQSHMSSHHFLVGTGANWQEKRLALKYRGGLIYNQKLAVRYGQSQDATCPLCDGQDSQSHLLGGCQDEVMSGMYNNRHNNAVKQLATALRARIPARCFIQSGVGPLWETAHFPQPRRRNAPASPASGSHSNSDPSDDSESETEEMLHSLPAFLPSGLVDWGSDRPRVPDLTWMTPRGTLSTPGTVHVVELKFGQDTRLEEKSRGALDILDSIAAAVHRKHPKCKVMQHLLLLGVGGRIPTATHESLTATGLTSTEATRLCNRLNLLAVRSLASIVRTRRVREHAHPKKGIG